MTVVSNTSPIANLAAVGRLELLERLYGRLVVPAAVFRELSAGRIGEFSSRPVSEIGWIEERAVRDRALAAHLRRHLHDGEAEAIVLALESRAELLLMDERVGRRLAVRAGLKVTGVLGALIEAKQRGAITAVRPVLDQLMVKAGFWVAAGLYARVVREAGE